MELFLLLFLITTDFLNNVSCSLFAPSGNPTHSLDINAIFLGLCPRYNDHVSGGGECSEEFISSIHNDHKDQPSDADIVVYLTLAQEGKLGLMDTRDFGFDSACEVLEHLCTPVIRLPDNARFRRSNSNSTSASDSTSGSESSEST
ncbi:uncharacterized protein LOC121406863 [Lytechinus variegatus]|uniref:uncharacterized protein LOC121406863 n=1 Tax=Lytechinus variegatus TaxID=7654 RepID=UPI001BB1BD08|nr:uncharacterized protein LOC121406863 [Lytechinus variegatus]